MNRKSHAVYQMVTLLISFGDP